MQYIVQKNTIQYYSIEINLSLKIVNALNMPLIVIHMTFNFQFYL